MVKKKATLPIKDLVREYFELRDKTKTIKKRMDELAKFIKEYATNNGTKDKNGSYYSETEDFVYGNQAKKSVSLNEEKAKTFFVAKGLYSQVIDVKEVFNEKKIEGLFSQGLITLEELETLMDTKVTYAIDLRQKTNDEEQPQSQMPEVQQVKAVRGLRKVGSSK